MLPAPQLLVDERLEQPALHDTDRTLQGVGDFLTEATGLLVVCDPRSVQVQPESKPAEHEAKNGRFRKASGGSDGR